MVCDVPPKQCLEWHIRPKLPRPVSYVADDGGIGYRTLGPCHDDKQPSFAIGLTPDEKHKRHQCFACGDRARERRALIEVYGIDPGCLPRSAKQKEDLLDYLERLIFCPTMDHAEARLRAAAALTSESRELPEGARLRKLREGVGVSNGAAYKILKRGARVEPTNTSSYRSSEKPVKPRSSEH